MIVKSNLSSKAGHYSVFDYLYCDASNYKVFGSIWLIGDLSDIEHAELATCLDSGEFFVAEQIGVPTLYSALFEYGGGPTMDDHAWHMFQGFRAKLELAKAAEVWGEASDLLAAFRSAKQNWHPELSPNFCC